MAYATYGVNDAMAIKLWSKQLAYAERANLDLADIMGEDEDSILQVKKETQKGKGDKVTYALSTRLTGAGIGEGMAADGNAEALSTFSDSLVIGELGHNVGVPSEDTIDAQRVPFNLREACRNRLAGWWADRKSASFFNQVCGYTPQTNNYYTGLNPVTAPSGDGNTNLRQIWQNTATTDQGLGSSDTFTTALIDKAVQYARSGNNMIRPIMIKGQPKYVIYLHEGQVTSLRTNTGANGWLDIHRTALSAGESTKSPIYNGALGEWNTCILRRSQDVTLGVNSSSGASVANVRRAVLLGAQAACIAFGMRNSSGDRFRWNEELKDHKRKLEVSAWSIWGMKKALYNSVDHGVLVMSTYSNV